MKTENNRLPDHLLDNYFNYEFLNKFSELLSEINILDVFNMVAFFYFCCTSNKILIELNFWLGMYVPYFLSFLFIGK